MKVIASYIGLFLILAVTSANANCANCADLLSKGSIELCSVNMEIDLYETEIVSYKMNFDYHVGYLMGKRQVLNKILRSCKDTNEFTDEVDLEFYNKPLLEYEGHIWRPILMQHHNSCPCKN